MYTKENAKTYTNTMYTQENAKTYTGTKSLLAWPATRGEYNAYRGWTIPANENAEDRGYLVEYLDGGAPNHPNHNGYISWSPADVFEQAYKEDAPQNWKTRLAAETAELRTRIVKLGDFINSSPDFRSLHPIDQGLLDRQLACMSTYYDVLERRLQRAEETKDA